MKNSPESLANWLTIEEIADLVCDNFNNIVQFIIDNRIPHGYYPDGILIPLGLFQMCMNDLYDLEADVIALQEAAQEHDEQDVLGLLTKYDRENRDV